MMSGSSRAFLCKVGLADENSQPLKRQNEFISIVDSKSAELSAGESLEDALAR